jgi:hypothetical protein
MFFSLILALIIVLLLDRRFELYVIPRNILDIPWKETRNEPKRAAGYFNTCSPESLNSCERPKIPLLSRY